MAQHRWETLIWWMADFLFEIKKSENSEMALKILKEKDVS